MREYRRNRLPVNTSDWTALAIIEDGSGEIAQVGIRDTTRSKNANNVAVRTPGPDNIHGVRVVIDGQEVVNESLRGESSNSSIDLNAEFDESMGIYVQNLSFRHDAEFYANYYIDIPEQPQSVIEKWVRKTEKRTGVSVDKILAIAGFLIGLIGTAIGVLLDFIICSAS